ncbi:MAG: hypothetical protein ABH826_03745 [Patescibacteria group bacterium]
MKANKQFKAAKKIATPSRAFKRVLWVELRQEFSKEYPGFRISWRQVVLVPLTVFVVVMMAGAGTYAYASPEVTQRHTLYPIKTGIESIEGKFHRNLESDMQFHMRMMDRRLDESEIIFERQQDEENYLDPVEHEMIIVIHGLDTDDLDPAMRLMIIQTLNMHQARFDQLAQQIIYDGTCGGPHEEMVRNKIGNIRVQITESGLSEEEKRALLESFLLEPINN